jgi:hypothetical protein
MEDLVNVKATVKMLAPGVLAAALIVSSGRAAYADAINPGPVTGFNTSQLQGVFSDIGSSINVINDQSNDALFTRQSSGGTINTLFFRNPNASFQNSFGIYSAADPSLKLQIFSGSIAPDDTEGVQFNANGSVQLIGQPASLVAGFGSVFGFYIQSNQAGCCGYPTQYFYSEDSLNPDQEAQALIYKGKGDNVNLGEAGDGVPGCGSNCFSDANEWYVAFGDLDNPQGPGSINGHGDDNYSDLVVQVESIQPIPEPGSVALFGSGLLMLAGAARRRLGKR